jgi:hypothetical protein
MRSVQRLQPTGPRPERLVSATSARGGAFVHRPQPARREEEPLRPSRALPRVSPAATTRCRTECPGPRCERELTDQFGELRIIEVAGAVAAQKRDGFPRDPLPLGIQRDRALVEEHEPGHVALPWLESVEVSEQHESERASNVTDPSSRAGLEETFTRISALAPADVADLIVYLTSRPPHVNISTLDIVPTEQA